MTRLTPWVQIVALPLVLLQSPAATTQSDTAAVARLSSDLKQDGVLTKRQSSAINACAIRAKFE